MGYKRMDLAEQKFGQWTVLERVKDNTYGHTKFLCRCDCGIERAVTGSCLKNGSSTACGLCRPYDFIDRIGNVYSKLVVIKKVDVRDNNNLIQWLCKCECGGEKVVAGKYLVNGSIKSCGCLANKLPDGESAFNAYYSKYINDSNKRGKKFSLTKEQFSDITGQNCHYCSAEPSQIKKTNANNGHYIANGIDRIDNNKGYHINNVVPCCAPCNYAKRNMTYNEFKSMIARIYHHMKLH